MVQPVFFLCICLLLGGLSLVSVGALDNGDDICAEGYIMDNYCIDLGFLLDNSRFKTLERPDKHSVHCLVDERSCRNSGFVVLNDLAPGKTLYTKGYALDDEGNERLINLARHVGNGNGCSTCTDGGSVREGMRAGIMATVVDASAEPPLIQVNSAEYVSADTVYCQTTHPPDPNAPSAAPTVTASPSFSSSPTSAPAESGARGYLSHAIVLVTTVASIVFVF